MTPAEYAEMQARVGLLASALIETDAKALDEFIVMAERANSMGPVLDPTLWNKGHVKLQEVIEHAQALSTARRLIVAASPGVL